MPIFIWTNFRFHGNASNAWSSTFTLYHTNDVTCVKNEGMELPRNSGDVGLNTHTSIPVVHMYNIDLVNICQGFNRPTITELQHTLRNFVLQALEEYAGKEYVHALGRQYVLFTNTFNMAEILQNFYMLVIPLPLAPVPRRIMKNILSIYFMTIG